jgi:FkbM family methyltransferase
LKKYDDLVYDVGANNGDDIDYYLYKGYRVLGIEADPTLMGPLEERFAAALAQKRLTLLNVALAPDRTIAPFWICEGHSLWNSFDREVASRNGHQAHAVDLECWPLRDVLAEFGVPHYLKLSLHGQEHFCLADLTPATAPELLSLELPRDCPTAENIVERLVSLGYQGFKVIDQTNQKQIRSALPPLRTRLRRRLQRLARLYDACGPLRDGVRRLGPASRIATDRASGLVRLGEWTFPAGSSGPFGDDTDGPWLPAESALRIWMAFLSERAGEGQRLLNVWHDLHASRVNQGRIPKR